MTTFREEIAIDFAELGDDNDQAAQWLRDNGLSADALDDLVVKVDVEIELSRFSDDEIEDEYERRFDDTGEDVKRIYRLMAEGAFAEAMEEMSRTFVGLASPSLETRIAERIAAGRAKELVGRQGELHV